VITLELQVIEIHHSYILRTTLFVYVLRKHRKIQDKNNPSNRPIVQLSRIISLLQRFKENIRAPLPAGNWPSG
jgi:hypothetical protein